MRSIKFNLSKQPANSWEAAVLLTEGYLSANVKADRIMEQLPPDFVGQARARCQSLFLGGLREGHRTRNACQPLFRHTPRPRVEAVLLVAGFEVVDAPPARHPKIVHHAVEQSKRLLRRGEQAFVNAVLRKLPRQLKALLESDDPAARHSHPRWLVDHWLEIFGTSETEALLEWNQRRPKLYLKSEAAGAIDVECLTPTTWSRFYEVDTKMDWKTQLAPFLASGQAYFKDPSTRLAPALLCPKPGQDVLDLCAAPGGKAFDLCQTMGDEGRLVCLDLPGARMTRLRENIDRMGQRGLQTAIIEHDLTEMERGQFHQAGLPESYDAVMLDAPCSNTGVIQRRTDVKWRLRAGDIAACAKLQQQLIHSAARFVKAGGALVYSTCSIEPSENEAIVHEFLKTKSGQPFKLRQQAIARPWLCGHDGASAFLLDRIGG